MSNQGIRGFYQLTETIKNALLDNVDVNTVTTGNLSNVNLQKQDIFSISHIIINSVTDSENTLTFSLSILAMDVVSRRKEEQQTFLLATMRSRIY